MSHIDKTVSIFSSREKLYAKNETSLCSCAKASSPATLYISRSHQGNHLSFQTSTILVVAV